MAAQADPTQGSRGLPPAGPPYPAGGGHSALRQRGQELQPQQCCLPLRLPCDDVPRTCAFLSELCEAEGMVDFSLWSAEAADGPGGGGGGGRLLLGRAGVELWQRATDLVTAYCCHFLVDGVPPGGEGQEQQQSLWDNTLWVRPDAGSGGAAFALSLTRESADAIFGRRAG